MIAMHLHRITPDPFEEYAYHRGGKFLGKASDDFRARMEEYDGQPAFPVVATRFERFGGGDKRRSDYEVLVEWKDVQQIIETFCEHGYPEALALREAMKLAAAAKELGWRQPGTALAQSN
jgi:hypothetical protein